MQSQGFSLFIDAQPAESGAAKFKAAIAAVKEAVAGLDRDTTGLFSKLARSKAIRLEVSGLSATKRDAEGSAKAVGGIEAASKKAADDLRRLALTADSSLRIATNAAARLSGRLADIGDVSGIARIQGQLTNLKTSLASATSTLDVREARNEYDNLQSSLNRSAMAAQDFKWQQNQAAAANLAAAKAADAHKATLEGLRSEFIPLHSATRQYEATLERIAMAEREGIVTADQSAAARQKATAALQSAATMTDRFTASTKNNSAATQQGIMAGQQLSDVLVTSQMGFQSVGTIALQQGSQLAAQLNGIRASGQGVFSTLLAGATSIINPLSIITIGAVAVTAAFAKWAFATEEVADKTKDAIKPIDAMRQAQQNLEAAVKSQTQPVSELTEKYGAMGKEMARVLELQSQIAQGEAIKGLKDGSADVASPLTAGDLSSSESMVSSFERLERLKFELANTIADQSSDPAANLLKSLDIRAELEGLRHVESNINRISAAYKISTRDAERLSIAAAKLREASTPNQTLAAAKALQSTMVAVFGSSAKASAATGEVWKNLIGVQQAAVEVGGSLGKVPTHVSSSLTLSKSLEASLRESALGANAIASANMAGNIGAALGPALSLASALWDAAEAMAQGRIAGAAVKRIPGGVDAIANGDIKIRDRGFKRPVIYTPPKTGGSGGSGGRVAELGDESGQLAKLAKQMNTRLFQIAQENDALKLLASGQASSKESAELMAAAMKMNGGRMDDATRSTVALYEAQVQLQKRLAIDAANPLREYLDSLPTAVSATRQAGADIAASLQDAIAGALSGDLDAKGIVDSLRRSLARASSGVIMRGLFGELADPTGTTQGAQVMGSSILSASAAGAAMYAQAIKGASITAPTSTTTGGGGGLIGSLIGFVGSIFGFSEGGYSNGPSPHAYTMPVSAFHNAPHYAQGTPNTSGIPAVLHPNEAVIPLSRGRKIPVEMNGGGGGGVNIGDTTMHIEVKVDAAGGDVGDEKTMNRLAGQLGQAVQQSVKAEMAAAMQYGGQLNPRGR